MRAPPTLHGFIDDELLRAPMAIDLVVDAVQQRWRERLSGGGRADADPVRVLHHHRAALAQRAMAELRRTALEDLQALQGRGAAAGEPGGLGAEAGRGAAPPRLALIDEADVAADIEIARCVQQVKTLADEVLLELQTFTSALVNDPNVSRDTNPFRPERFVRALWAGVQMLPLDKARHAAFLHDAAEPLAKVLQRSYAAACRRLEEQGVQPASHRTIVFRRQAGWGSTGARYQLPDSLRSLHASMPMAAAGASGPAPMPAGSLAAGAAGWSAAGGPVFAPLAAPAPGHDARLDELLNRLFHAIGHDFNLSADTAGLLQRLQPTALRVAQRDPSLLDRYDHALWRFMDQLAHDVELASPSQRPRLVGLGRNLVDHLASTDGQDQHGFAWALERLLAARSQLLNQSIAAAQGVIDRLQRVAEHHASPSTDAMPLDVGTLDTVPAALMPEEPPPTLATLEATGLPAGATLRAYLQGERRTVVSLWQDRHRELALLREPASERLFAVRQRAIARLQAEGLAHVYKVRSLVRRSADRVLRGL